MSGGMTSWVTYHVWSVHEHIKKCLGDDIYSWVVHCVWWKVTRSVWLCRIYMFWWGMTSWVTYHVWSVHVCVQKCLGGWHVQLGCASCGSMRVCVMKSNQIMPNLHVSEMFWWGMTSWVMYRVWSVHVHVQKCLGDDMYSWVTYHVWSVHVCVQKCLGGWHVQLGCASCVKCACVWWKVTRSVWLCWIYMFQKCVGGGRIMCEVCVCVCVCVFKNVWGMTCTVGILYLFWLVLDINKATNCKRRFCHVFRKHSVFLENKILTLEFS